jgi:hypothetical protein
LQVKLRAWRRIGEILSKANVDKSTCVTGSSAFGGLTGAFNMAEYIRRVRAAFKGQKSIEELTDNAMRQALKIAELPLDFFDQNIEKHVSIDSMVGAFALLERREFERSPEGKIELEMRRKNAEQREAAQAAWHEKWNKAEQERQQIAKQDAAELAAFKVERDKAFEEVGITLDRRDRDEMHQIVFLLKKKIYELLRTAAFNNRTTMQAILRSGLLMWFIAHGYDIPPDVMGLRPTQPNQSATHPE